MNAIDDIGAKVGQTRGHDNDQDYALRVLEKLYRTYQAVNAEGWTGDQETNEYNYRNQNGYAIVTRGKGSWCYCVASNGILILDGKARYLEKAMQICSLALAP